jgi:ribonuclease J
VTDHFLKMIPLGGMGEFGMNSLAVYCGQSIVVIDAGLLFPKDDLLGVDLVIPDFEFLRENRERVRAILLTHGHEDHIGALPYLLKTVSAPVYGTPLTLGLVKNRLSDHGVLEETDLVSVQPRDVLEFEDLKIEFVRMTHSIADSLGLVLETPAGTIVHTGDFKLDQSPPNSNTTDYARLAHFGERGVLALLSDSTNSERPGFTQSENYVRRHIEQIFHTCKGKIILACFASSIHRIQIVLDLACSFGRKVVPVGRSMKQNIAIAADLGYLNMPKGVLVDIVESRSLDSSELVVLSTGTQGEPMAALTRLAFGNHKDFSVEEDDAIILSARVIPGNESRVSRLVNHFCRRGARVYDERQWSTHVSGHASQEELKLMLNLTRPRFFIPVHGEYRQLYAHTLLAREVGIPKERIILAETGDILALEPDSVKIVGKAPVGRRFIDEGGIADLDEFVVRDRLHLSEEGIVLAVAAVNKATGRLEGKPELISRGHVQREEGESFLAEARQIIVDTIEACSEEEREDPLLLSDAIRAELKRYFRKQTGTRPMIVPVIYEI